MRVTLQASLQSAGTHLKDVTPRGELCRELRRPARRLHRQVRRIAQPEHVSFLLFVKHVFKHTTLFQSAEKFSSGRFLMRSRDFDSAMTASL